MHETLADTRAFVESLPELALRCSCFRDADLVRIARAPGRLDVMGGIADYSGSRVLELPLDCATHAAIGPRDDRRIRVVSAGPERGRSCEVLLDEFRAAARSEPAEVRRLLSACGSNWASYALGPLVVLMREDGLDPQLGFDLLITSEVPSGAGVSSSAAIEVACANAFCAFFAHDIEPIRLALACQTAENLIAGAPCGAMDQITSQCGRADRLLQILCRPAGIEGHVAIPGGVRFFGIDSGTRHSVAGNSYADVRTAAFMGLRILCAQRADWSMRRHLCEFGPDELDGFESALPESVLGREFLALFDGIADHVTRVDPERRYPLRAATAHPIREHDRVTRFAALLPRAAEPAVAEQLGALMYASHASYGSCGLGSAATDALVEDVRAVGPGAGLFGAKITGGGSGGTVAILARDDAHERVIGVARRHAARTAQAVRVFDGSSPGAAASGILDLRWPRGTR
ncbi:MAG: galactokinase family protein [Planctomycetota bacterium]